MSPGPGTAPLRCHPRSPTARSGNSSGLAAVSLAALFNVKVTGRIGYQGPFGSDLRDNVFYGSLVITFGGK